MTESSRRLLVAGDPPPVAVENPGGRSALVLIGDHAGDAIPVALGDLGLSASDRARHIAVDIGVAGLGAALAQRLDAVFLRQRYSRLVIDCNRDPASPGSIPTESDGSAVPGNVGLSAEQRQARIADVFEPHHDRIAAELDARAARRQPTILVSLHSFTPVLGAAPPRPWRFGVLHRSDSAFSRATLAALRSHWGKAVGDNQPYAMDGIDYTVPHHADPRGLDYLELEVRQDTIAAAADQAAVADALAPLLAEALAAARQAT